MTRASREVAPVADSALALARRVVAAGSTERVGDREADTLLYVASGAGSVSLGETSALAPRSAALVPAGEEATIGADDDLELVVMTVGSAVDRHAPMGRPALTVSLDDTAAQQATGARSFQVLFDASNGSTRATLFAGFVPPGRHRGTTTCTTRSSGCPKGRADCTSASRSKSSDPGSAFRLRPREVHIVENTSAERELTIIGLFTPAGSPSAAYLTPEIAAEYRFSG